MRISPRQFQTYAREAVDGMPNPFRDHLAHVIIEIQPLPDRQTLRDMELDDPSELMGLYHGVPLTERSVDDAPTLPDKIVLYQQNIQSVCQNRDELIHEIRVTVLHEIGHHFGLDEDDLEKLGYA